MRKNILYTIVILGIFVSCDPNDHLMESGEDRGQQISNTDVSSLIPEAQIYTTRKTYNLIARDSALFHHNLITMPGTRGNSARTATEQEYISQEIVVLPQYLSKIWLGNVVTRNSVMDNTYCPIPGKKQDIEVSSTLPSASPAMISNPSYSQFNSFVQQQIREGSFKQNAEIKMDVDQFVSYNELAKVFGNNSNTNSLFWGKSNTTKYEEHHIQKKTGLYIKYLQKSFTVSMDTPTPPYADINGYIMDSAVYVNSVTYGRMGILTLETNYDAESARVMIQKCHKKLFSNKQQSFTKEESKFLNGCTFRLIEIGNSGSSAVQCFNGADEYKQHITNATFSRSNPGTPIFCTFANVKDNSPCHFKLKFIIGAEPLYIDLIEELYPVSPDVGSSPEHRFSVNFFSDRNHVPALGDPSVVLRFQHLISYDHEDDQCQPSSTIKTFRCDADKKGMKLFNFIEEETFTQTPTQPEQYDFEVLNVKHERAWLLDSPDYEVLEHKIIDRR